MDAKRAAEEAKESLDSVDEARRLRETSQDLRDRAVTTATTIEEGLRNYYISTTTTLCLKKHPKHFQL